ncbi:MAG: flagellar protein FlbD [Planctomycetaceae bacterium]
MAVKGIVVDDSLRGNSVIKLTKLNGDEFVVNAELIRYVERRPDTYVTLTTDDRFIVKESLEEVVSRSIAYSRAVRLAPAA